MRSRMFLIAYLCIVAILGYLGLSDLFSVAYYFVGAVFCTVLFFLFYSKMYRSDILTELHGYIHEPEIKMKIFFTEDEDKLRLACRVNVIDKIIEINYSRFMRYPKECRYYMIRWSVHRAAQFDLNQLRVDPHKKDQTEIMLDCDHFAFQDYIHEGFRHEVLESNFMRDQMMIGEFKVQRHRKMREHIEKFKLEMEGKA